MREEQTARRLQEAHEIRDSLIERWKGLVENGTLHKDTDHSAGGGMTGFKRYSEEETRRLNRLQAAYFSKNVHVFDPPLPEGVPERLRKIISVAEINIRDSVLDIGTGTGILIPLIQEYAPARIYANDLSEAMLEAVKVSYPFSVTMLGDAADLALPDASIEVVFINACYSNIIDKHNTFTNIRRMLRPGGRLIISHPLGRSFIEVLKKNVPFPLDDFPSGEAEAGELFRPYGLRVSLFLDEEQLYILRLERPFDESPPSI
jgi:SAM-dependent methyltransferase